MKNSILLASFLTVAVATTVLAADVLVRVGRWEVTGEVKYGPQRPQGVPASDKYTDIECVTEKFVLDAKTPIPMPEDCNITNYVRDGRMVKFTASCDENIVDYSIESTADTYHGTTVSRGKDPATHFTARFEAKRTGSRCSAEELAEQGGE